MSRDRQFTEQEATSIATLIRETIDVPRRKSEPATKTILVDFFGMPNAGKTQTTKNIERFFRRTGYNVFCPPETAEIAAVRNLSSSDNAVFQMRHVDGVSDWVLNLSHSRDFHLAIISRGLIDMLYWYERGGEKQLFDEAHIQAMKNWIREQIFMNLVDAYFFFTCDPKASLEREYGQSVTTQRGSNVNEKGLARATHLYAQVIRDVQERFPDLPLFTIDTTRLTIQETGQEVLRLLLPHLCQKFAVNHPAIS